MTLNEVEIKNILGKYGILTFENYTMIDSSHGDFDIRHNYIIDKKYVLRVNSAKVMDEERLKELNLLIARYNKFGYKAPYFLSYNDKYVIKYKGYYCYLSEYLNYEIADNIKDKCKEELIKERVALVAKFANAYKNIDIIDTLSMYSLFDLCPYDQIMGLGIDEKQDNFNTLLKDLIEAKEIVFAEVLKCAYEKYREELKGFYKNLPKCVFQGDENFSNLCVDERNHIIGLFDFNMSGTEVIANYLANIALQGNDFYTEEILEQYSAQDIFRMLIDVFEKNTSLIQQYYTFDELEYHGYKLYVKIAMISGYWNQCVFSEYIKNRKHKDKVVNLLQLIIDYEL